MGGGKGQVKLGLVEVGIYIIELSGHHILKSLELRNYKISATG